MRRYVEVRGNVPKLLAELATFPTGMTRPAQTIAAQLVRMVGFLLVLGVGFGSAVAVSALWTEVYAPGGNFMATRAALFFGSTTVLAIWGMVGGLWWRWCRRSQNTHLARRFDMAYQLMARMTPFVHPHRGNHVVRVLSYHAPRHPVVRVELARKNGRVVIGIREPSGDAHGVCLVDLEMRGDALPSPAALLQLHAPGAEAPVVHVARKKLMVRGLRLWRPPSEQGDPATHLSDTISATLALAGLPVHEHHTTAHAPVVSAAKAVHLAPPEVVPPTFPRREDKALLLPRRVKRGRWTAVSRWWRSRYALRCLALGTLSGATFASVPLAEMISPGVSQQIDLSLLSGFAMLMLGMPGVLGWWWEPSRRLRARRPFAPVLSLLSQRLSLASPDGCATEAHIDLAQPFEVSLTREPTAGDNTVLLGVEVRQKNRDRWERLRFCVPTYRGAQTRPLARRVTTWPVLESSAFHQWIWPALQHSAALYGQSLPAVQASESV